MGNKKYKVTILQTHTTEPNIKKFAKLFKITQQKAEEILAKPSFIIKKQTDKATADKYQKLITAAGVKNKIEEERSPLQSALPTIENVQTTAQVKPLLDITRQTIKPLQQSTPMNLSLVTQERPKPNEAEVKVKEEAEKRAIKDIDPDNFCPNCGTIRAAPDSICNHCGYDPDKINHSNKKRVVIIASLFITVLAVLFLIGNPYYQQYTKRIQIAEDLKLAFDVRNKVSDFILKTNFWPNQNIDAGLEKNISNQSIKSVLIGENASITVTIKGQTLDGEDQTLILTPHTLKGRIVWNCRKGTLSEKFRPDICRANIVSLN